MTTDFIKRMSERFEEAEAEFEVENPVAKNIKTGEQLIVMMSPKDIDAWEYRDRQKFELGDIDELADSIEAHKQVQPIVVAQQSDILMAENDKEAKYVVIAGYRRWLACKSRNMKVKAVIENMSFDDAIDCLVTENEKKSVTDFGKGMFYYNLLKKEGVKKNILYERLRIKRTTFNNYLSFAEVPADVWEAVGDMEKVSARTAGVIKSICEKGEAEKRALISIAGHIKNGAGGGKINSLVVRQLLGGDKIEKKQKATRVTYSNKLALEVKDSTFKIVTNKLSENSFAALERELSTVLEGFSFSENIES